MLEKGTIVEAGRRADGSLRTGTVVDVVDGGYMVEWFDEVYGQTVTNFFPSSTIVVVSTPEN